MSRNIEQNRLDIERVLSQQEKGLLAIVGPCSNQIDRRIVNEGRQLAGIATDSLVTVHRIPPWKPRSPVPEGSPQPWNGLEHTNPIAAHSRTLWETRRSVPVGLEFGKPEHIERYGHLTSFGWIGSRNVTADDIVPAIVSEQSLCGLTIGVKNGMNGKIDKARSKMAELTKQDQPNVLIFRGGNQFQNPGAWARQYKHVHEIMRGRFIVDVAHGGEMAHDPSGKFQKSVEGQRACLQHVIELARQGFAPAGVMVEASDHVYDNPYRQTDPNLPFKETMDAVIELHEIVTSNN